MSASAVLRSQAAQLEALASVLRAQADALEAEPPKDGSDPLITRTEAGVDARTWRAAIRTRVLKGFLVGRAYRARKSDVEAWLASTCQPRPEVARKPRERTTPANDATDDEFDRIGRGGRR